MSVNRSDARRTISRRKSADCAYVTPLERRREISLANPRAQGVLASSLEAAAEVGPPAGAAGTHVPGTIAFLPCRITTGRNPTPGAASRTAGEACDVARGSRARPRDVFAVAFARRPSERAREAVCARRGRGKDGEDRTRERSFREITRAFRESAVLRHQAPARSASTPAVLLSSRWGFPPRRRAARARAGGLIARNERCLLLETRCVAPGGPLSLIHI